MAQTSTIKPRGAGMKKMEANKYPHSATLFQFCKQALAIKYEGNVKVIDQDVGAILGYDPADCSHWKKGKKNVKALPIIKQIADYLHVDEKLIIDITSGKIGLDEALFEYQGYGDFHVSQRYLDSMKKEYFRNPQKWGHKNGVLKSFEEIFDVQRTLIETQVETLFNRTDIKEAPVYLPELIGLFPDINLVPVDDLPSYVDVTFADGKFSIRHQAGETKPYLRFLIAKELAKVVLFPERVKDGWKTQMTKVEEIRINIFAACILIPSHILKREVEKINITMDLVEQLAELFWVSKGLVNHRLKDFLLTKY